MPLFLRRKPAGVSVNQPGDPYEREADAVAERVVQGEGTPGPVGGAPAGEVQRCACDQGGATCAACAEQEEEEEDAARYATEIHDALDWWDDEAKALDVLRGRSDAMRQAIRDQFWRRYETPLTDYLTSNLGGDDLVNAFALLDQGNDVSDAARMGRALIPAGTRDQEVFDLLYSRPLAERRQMENHYDRAFYQIGNGSLEDDLADDLSGWRRQKALALLDRNELTTADEIWFDSGAIAGSHDDAVIGHFEKANREGIQNIGQVIRDWDRYVRNMSRWTKESWCEDSLRTAMDDELSGESWLIVKAILDGYDKVTGLIASVAMAKEGEGGRPRDFVSEYEDVQLGVAWAILEASTTGGLTGAGTNEEQVYHAVREIHRIWQGRITRAAKGGSAAEQWTRASWEVQRRKLMLAVKDDISEGSSGFMQANLLSYGGLTTADEIWLASRQNDKERVISLVTRAWADGTIDRVIAQAKQPRYEGEGAERTVVRPYFQVMLAVPVNSGHAHYRLYALVRSGGSAESRGAERLGVELFHGDSNEDLQRAYDFLTTPGLPAATRRGLIERFAADELQKVQVDEAAVAALHSPASPAEHKLLAFLDRRFEKKYGTYLFRDLLDPTTDPTEMLARARGKYAATHSGMLAGPEAEAMARMSGMPTMGDLTLAHDTFTGEDTALNAKESLAQLELIVQQAEKNPDALKGMMAETGAKTPQALAGVSYEQFGVRLDELRALHASIVEAVATVAEIAIDLALTVATGGAAGAAVLASLASTLAGIAIREAYLGKDYDSLTKENAAKILTALAAQGMGALGRGFVSDVLTPQRLEELGKMGKFIEGAAADVSSRLGSHLANGALVDSRLPGAEELASLGLAFAGSALGSGAKGWMSHGAHDLTGASQRLRASLVSSVTGRLFAGMSQEAGTLFQPGASNLSGGEIFSGFGKTGFTSVAHGLAAGLSEFGADEVARARAAQGAQADETEHADEDDALPVKKPKPGSDMSPEELDAQLELVRNAKTRPVTDPELRGDYDEETDGPDGSTWRRRRDGSWCRFASAGVCTFDSPQFKQLSKTKGKEIRKLVRDRKLDPADVGELLKHELSDPGAVIRLLGGASPEEVARLASLVKTKRMPIRPELVDTVLAADPSSRPALIEKLAGGAPVEGAIFPWGDPRGRTMPGTKVVEHPTSKEPIRACYLFEEEAAELIRRSSGEPNPLDRGKPIPLPADESFGKGEPQSSVVPDVAGKTQDVFGEAKMRTWEDPRNAQNAAESILKMIRAAEIAGKPAAPLYVVSSQPIPVDAHNAIVREVAVQLKSQQDPARQRSPEQILEELRRIQFVALTYSGKKKQSSPAK